MRWNKRVIIFLLINFVLCWILWFFIWNKLYGHKDHWEEEYIEKYNIQCDEGNHIESFYHDPSRRYDLVPMEEFYTLDIYCVDENNVKNWIYYKFGWDTPIEKWYFLNWEMDWERNLYLYDEVVHYKNWIRDEESWYYSDWNLRYTWWYISGTNERQETFYYEDWSISTIRIYSGNDLVERREFYEDGKIKYECLDGWACISYDENWKITRKTPNNHSNYSWEELWTYPNWQLERVLNYKDGKYDGRYTKYYENGQISYQCNYNLWKEERCLSYNEEWELKKETRYHGWTSYGDKKTYDTVMGRKYGKWPYTWYYENGEISFTCLYIWKKEEWRCVHYKRNWEIEEEHRFHNWIAYNKAGYESLMRQERLANKPYNGPFTWYYEDGKIYYTCSYIQWQEEWRCAYYKENWEVESELWFHEWSAYSESLYNDLFKR